MATLSSLTPFLLVSSLHNAKQQSRVQILSTSSKPLAHVRPATATVPTSSFEGNGATFVQPPPFELRKSKPPSPVSPLASVVQSLPADGSSIPHDHVGHLPRIKNHSCIVAWFVIPIFPVFSVRGLEQLAVGSPLAVALPIVVVSSVSIRVSVEGLESSLFWNVYVQYWLQLSNRNWELVKIITSSGTESVVSLPDRKTKAGPILVAINPFKKVSLYGNDYIEAYKRTVFSVEPRLDWLDQ
ncbi:hypothetical protein Ahy_A01g002422 isoform A [Arachis hypogaea]|uniref:Myosin-1-3 N-terminal SH3 domain-containing protein n=1 Tax=Arachis hypogaea TaxID=3818 RepID=A0A445EQP6_ARAHY|nr:hypothetical protein Ahy_A01g002422 isoform A [Arachis hypogaea]